MSFKKNLIMRKIRHFNESFVDREFFVRLKNKKLTVVIEGEEIYIEFMTVPKVKNFRIYDLIKNELIYKFGTIDNIIFDYRIVEEKENSIETIVYCINVENFYIFKKENYNGEAFVKVNLIQNYIVNYLSHSIGEEEYFLAFKYKRNIYFLLIIKNNLVANKVIKVDKNINSYTEEFVSFLDSYSEEYSFINKIYTLDMNLLNTELNNFIVIKLKELNSKEFLNYIILKG